MTKPGMTMNLGGPGGITMFGPSMPFMPWTMPGLPGTMNMNGMTMTMPGMTMAKPGMPMTMSGMPRTMTMNGMPAMPSVLSHMSMKGTELPAMTVATPGVVSNVGNQIGVQMGRKKRAAQFNNWGSQIGQQISGGYGGGWGGFGGYRGFGGGQFNNYGSQIGQQFGRKKRSAQFNNWGSQIGQQISGGVSSHFGPLCGSFGCLPRFNPGGGGGFNNYGSQIGRQIDQSTKFIFPGMNVRRKKRSAQFNNWGSQIGQQIDQSTRFNFGPMPSMGGGFGRGWGNY